MKQMIFGILGLVLIAAAGFGMYYTFFGKAASPSAHMVRLYYIAFDPIPVSIYRDERVVRQMVVELQLETAGEENKDKVLNIKPRLENAFLQDLNVYIPEQVEGEQRVDIAVIKKRLLLVANRTLGQNVVRNVLIESAIDRPLVQ